MSGASTLAAPLRADASCTAVASIGIGAANGLGQDAEGVIVLITTDWQHCRRSYE
jgi:hypothetical protein